MREIKSDSRFKFRAWDCELKKFIDFTNPKNGIEFCDGDLWVSSGYDGYGRPTYEEDYGDRMVIMQYTGLKDKNGVEIYGGDLPKDCWNNIHEVKYSGCEWLCPVVKKVSPLYPAVVLSATYMKWEVIGNIYENPELLNS